ncbi:MAG: ORF6N domain-containing protein [Treponema sp.]|nr:ORF6N domain-containing protein [Treponema sp.]
MNDGVLTPIKEKEFNSLRCQIGTSKENEGGRLYLPYVFTEYNVLPGYFPCFSGVVSGGLEYE